MNTRKSYFTFTENHLPGLINTNLYSYNIENPKAISNQTIVFIHGLFSEGILFEQVAQGIMSQDQRIERSILLDLPNHGKSDRTNNMTYDQLSNDVISHLDTLGVGKYIIFSHSMGSKTSMLMSMKRQNDIQGVIILDTYPLDYFEYPEIYTNTLNIISTLKDLDISKMTKEDVCELISSKLVKLRLL
jgi:pimeloyl-ACP methyl ester carboxylesterase